MARQIATAALNVARDSHYELNPVTGLYERALLLEGSRANALPYSQEMDNAAWSKVNTSVVANATTAPDGTATADKIVEDAANSTHGVAKVGLAGTDSTLQTVSGFVKAGERAVCLIRSQTKAGTLIKSWVNLTTGAKLTTDANHTITVRELGNGWFRISATFNIGTGASTPFSGFYCSTGNAVEIYTGDGVSGIYVWGIQHEVDAPFASSYIPTTTVAVTRAADNLAHPFSLPPQETTFFARFIDRGTSLVANQRVLQAGVALTGAVNPNSFRIVSANPGRFYVMLNNGGADTTVETSAAALSSIGKLVELRAVISPTGAVTAGISVDGAAEVVTGPTAAGGLPAAWGGAYINIGALNGVAAGFAAFLGDATLGRKPIVIARGTKSMAQMRALAGVS